MKYNINDILAYNHQGSFMVGIVTKITILDEDIFIYSVSGLDSYVDIPEESIVAQLGNAKDIKREYERALND